MSEPIDWNGPKRQTCPECGRRPTDRTLGVTLDPDGHGVAHCFRCEYVEWRQGDGTSRHEPGRGANVPEQCIGLSEWAEALWRSCKPIAGAALDYLQARGCAIPPADGDLRYHPALTHGPTGQTHPALVALITDSLTGAPISIHRTWVRADGRKAPVVPPRMLLSGHRKQGGAVRLWPDEAVTTGLLVAEGIETALACAQDFKPVWSCVDYAGNLGAFPVLDGIESLVIAADNDPAGLSAADNCAARWAEAGVDVRIVAPDVDGADWADMRATA